MKLNNAAIDGMRTLFDRNSFNFRPANQKPVKIREIIYCF